MGLELHSIKSWDGETSKHKKLKRKSKIPLRQGQTKREKEEYKKIWNKKKSFKFYLKINLKFNLMPYSTNNGSTLTLLPSLMTLLPVNSSLDSDQPRPKKAWTLMEKLLSSTATMSWMKMLVSTLVTPEMIKRNIIIIYFLITF